MSNIINKNLINLNIENNNKEEIIKILANMMKDENRLNNYEAYVEDVLHRENLVTTGFGYGIAIPHGRSNSVDVPTIAIGKIRKGMDWNSLDGKLVYVVFLLAVPEKAESDEHLRILASLSRNLINDEFRQELFDSVDEEALLEYIIQWI